MFCQFSLFKNLITHHQHAATSTLESFLSSYWFRGNYDFKYCCTRSHLKYSAQDSSWGKMDSEEFAITSSVTSHSTLIFTGFAAKSCQLIVPHNMTLPDICLVFTSRYLIESWIRIESRLFFYFSFIQIKP